jgi:hypothetical protein
LLARIDEVLDPIVQRDPTRSAQLAHRP